MSTVVNDSFERGEVVTDAGLSAKFTDIASATSDIDAANVRNESFDRFNLDHNAAASNAEIILKDARSQSNAASHTAGTVYPASETRTNRELAHASGTRITFGAAGKVIDDGDVLRVYWHVWADEYTKTTTASADRQNSCWLVWLQWDVTSNALANFTEVPGQSAFNTDYGADGSALARVVGGPVSETAATMVLPHMTRYTDSVPSSAYVPYRDLTAFRVYEWVNDTGAPVTIYGLRIVMDGLFYPWYTAGTPINRFVHQEADPYFQSDDVEIGPAYMISVIQRTK